MSQSESTKSVVLLSSGLDSTYNLYKAHEQSHIVMALTFDYGQRAAAKEIQYSKKLCQKLKIPHQVIELNFFNQFATSSLLNQAMEVPTGSHIQMDDIEISKQSAKSVWVPNRNGIFLNIGAGFAEALGAKYIVPGFNKEEAATFPDNSAEYIERLNQSFALSTANQVEVSCYSTEMTKTEIVAETVRMRIDLADIWPCYFSGDSICGTCESCQRFLRSLRDNNVELA